MLKIFIMPMTTLYQPMIIKALLEKTKLENDQWSVIVAAMRYGRRTPMVQVPELLVSCD